MIRSTATRFVAAAGLLLIAACGEDADVPDAASSIEPELEAATDTLGVFDLDGRRFTAIVAVLRHGDAETVREFRIMDDDGVVHLDEEFAMPAVMPYGFERSYVVDVDVLAGHSGRAFLITRQVTPSAPLTGVTLQLVSERDGQLEPLAAPLSYYGTLQEPARDGSGALVLQDGDMLLLDLWRYHYGATLPLRLDLTCEAGTEACVLPAPRRLEVDSTFGSMDVSVDMRDAAVGEYITLYPVPAAESGQRIRIHEDSNIQVLQAAARVSLRAGETLDVVLRDEHLRIRIDGQEGWIRGPESFEAIGLPAAG
ncbi:MAG TPA: hypothetical protein VK929_14320 [Longimicrobiales bacterium]|nr:hypothetical protein [Longimicrobiales bacterium]